MRAGLGETVYHDTADALLQTFEDRMVMFFVGDTAALWRK